MVGVSSSSLLVPTKFCCNIKGLEINFSKPFLLFGIFLRIFFKIGFNSIILNQNIS